MPVVRIHRPRSDLAFVSSYTDLTALGSFTVRFSTRFCLRLANNVLLLYNGQTGYILGCDTMSHISRTGLNEEWAHNGVVEAGGFVFISYLMKNEGQPIEN